MPYLKGSAALTTIPVVGVKAGATVLAGIAVTAVQLQLGL